MKRLFENLSSGDEITLWMQGEAKNIVCVHKVEPLLAISEWKVNANRYLYEPREPWCKDNADGSNMVHDLLWRKEEDVVAAIVAAISWKQNNECPVIRRGCTF